MKLNKMVKKRLLIFFIFLPLLIISGILVLMTMNGIILSGLDHRQLRRFTENVGFYGMFIFAIPIALFVFRLGVKYITPKGVTLLKGILSKIKIKIPNSIEERFLNSEYLEDVRYIFAQLAKFMQKLHIPIALFGVSVIGYHVYLAFHLGWVWSLGYIFGLIAAIFLLIITLTGIARIFNKSIKTHKFLMFGFVIFTGLHFLFI
ncbi:MAG: hypothetical protein ACRC41_04770 [Sarcina sp.]